MRRCVGAEELREVRLKDWKRKNGILKSTPKDRGEPVKGTQSRSCVLSLTSTGRVSKKTFCRFKKKNPVYTITAYVTVFGII